jgi:hypothetical protein
MSLLVDALLVVLGLSIMRWNSRRGRWRNLTQITRLIADNERLFRENGCILKDRQALAQKMVVMEQNRVLDQQVAEEAVRRELRAKKALQAVLEKNHCTQAQIEKVMDSVDGVEIGDF